MTRPTADPLDLELLAELRANIDLAALLAVVDVFEADASQRVSEICAAVHARDADTLKDAAHALKGASANLGAAHVARLSGRLEELAHAADLDPAPALAAELMRAVRAAPAALRDELGG